jgi:hypothetical protein
MSSWGTAAAEKRFDTPAQKLYCLTIDERHIVGEAMV